MAFKKKLKKLFTPIKVDIEADRIDYRFTLKKNGDYFLIIWIEVGEEKMKELIRLAARGLRAVSKMEASVIPDLKEGVTFIVPPHVKDLLSSHISQIIKDIEEDISNRVEGSVYILDYEPWIYKFTRDKVYLFVKGRAYWEK